jgi:hypothetical protein
MGKQNWRHIAVECDILFARCGRRGGDDRSLAAPKRDHDRAESRDKKETGELALVNHRAEQLSRAPFCARCYFKSPI